jgi:hypothetical protein
MGSVVVVVAATAEVVSVVSTVVAEHAATINNKNTDSHRIGRR